MTTKEVTVTKYIACDNQEFTTRQECEAHEREVTNLLEHEVYELRCDKRKLLYAINEARIKARISWIDAQNEKSKMRSAKSKSKYCAIMSIYWHWISEYNIKRRELRDVRCKISELIDRLYIWFRLHKRSWIARLERKRRSDEWRKANTPDKWRTPYKIRVSKQPKEDNNE